MLISETDLTTKNHIEVLFFNIYDTKHLSDLQFQLAYLFNTPHLHNKNTKWIRFRKYQVNYINCYISLKSPEQVEDGVINFTAIIQQAGWDSAKP
ncbi:hypothetical protein M0802_012409 [Mischocyttarus mexicanus]|nr:hypothetical protein M0802_012409 [Mischocyttarus mexicanus]